MSYDINQDPALPDWDEDAELTPEEAKRTTESIWWAMDQAGENATPAEVEACERDARKRRLRMTPAERAKDDRKRAAVVERVRPGHEAADREFWEEQAERCGMTPPYPDNAAIAAAYREWGRKRHAMFEKLSDEEAIAVLKQEGLFQNT